LLLIQQDCMHLQGVRLAKHQQRSCVDARLFSSGGGIGCLLCVLQGPSQVVHLGFCAGLQDIDTVNRTMMLSATSAHAWSERPSTTDMQAAFVSQHSAHQACNGSH
jgi:hypothetical protein